jgi:hypothetical protein
VFIKNLGRTPIQFTYFLLLLPQKYMIIRFKSYFFLLFTIFCALHVGITNCRKLKDYNFEGQRPITHTNFFETSQYFSCLIVRTDVASSKRITFLYILQRTRSNLQANWVGQRVTCSDIVRGSVGQMCPSGEGRTGSSQNFALNFQETVPRYSSWLWLWIVIIISY